MSSCFFLVLIVLTVITVVISWDLDKVIDLTHVVNNNTIAWPSATQVTVKKVYRGPVAKSEPDPPGPASNKFWYEAQDISQAEHSGTHTDAPAHFAEGGWRVDQIPLYRLSGPGVTLDISRKVAKDGLDTTLSVDDIIGWEEEHGEIGDGAIVVVHTGHGRLYGDKKRYLGRPSGETFPDNDTDHLHFPGVSSEAATWLVKNRRIIGLGIDTPSIDPGYSRVFPAHQILYGENIWGLENLANTDQLPPTGYILHNMVHKIGEGSGGPSRVVAVLGHQTGDGARRGAVGTIVIICLLTCINIQYLF
jgi:kynurenine formamidase